MLLDVQSRYMSRSIGAVATCVKEMSVKFEGFAGSAEPPG
jgi:hypothetical protein